ncbi:AAA family ATPase, partial [Methanophagales archaeon]
MKDRRKNNDEDREEKGEEKSVVLRVAEAYHRDAGRGIARIDTETMRKLGVVSGDVIEIEGKNIATAIVWPGYSPDSNKSIIRIDGNIRANAGVAIDDRVRIKKTKVKEAKKVTLEPTQPVRIAGGERYIARILKGRPITKGQIIRVEMLGNPITFVVTNTIPLGTVIPQIDTEIVLRKPREEAIGVPHVTYEDIGGLKREIGMIREMIELPLRHPELFERLGIDPPKGVLLHGPPGTGKTLIAKAVATETDANFYSISGPEIMSKFYGESEKHLRDIFEEARKNAPSIIFIDELDSIAPKRGETTGEVERRVVAQLLSLMDGLESRGQVVVVGATNRVNALDEALRRGGRFDREIEIGIPDRNGREEILQVHTRGMPLAEDVNLKEFADLTHGFVGADLASLCKEAAMHALRKILPEIDIEKEIPPEVMEKLKVTKEDFGEALKSTEPSALREVFVEVPNVKWD